MKKIFISLFVLIIIALSVYLGYYFYQKNQKDPIVYETEKPQISDIIKKTVATGAVIPKKEIELKSQVSGVIEKIYLEPGQIVKVGDLIAKVQIIPDEVSLSRAQSSVATARINFESTQRELDRQEKLFQQRIISEQTYNEFLVARDLAKENLEDAENTVQLIREGASKKSGRASNLVKSTASGMILDIPVKEGSFVIESNTFNDGTTIATIADMNVMIFEGTVDESEVGKLKEGMDLNLTIGALEDYTFTARLDYISPKGLDEEGTIKFEIKAPVELRDDAFIRSGYSANADIVLDRADSVLSVKESLLQFSGDTAYVEIETGEQVFERRNIETGISDGIVIEVKSGIDSTARIKVPKSL